MTYGGSEWREEELINGGSVAGQHHFAGKLTFNVSSLTCGA